MSYLGDIMKQQVPIITFDSLRETGLVSHGFSTRKGGVSEGCFSTMNLGFSRGDDENNVKANFKIIADKLKMPYKDMVLSAQTHTANVRVVTSGDKGKGIAIPKDYDNVDGLMTNEAGIPLVTFYADCVPLFFLDTENKVIALSHSGWRGTVKKMGFVTVKKMEEAYGSKPENILACIGPSICQNCYEVSEDVAEEFEKAFKSGEMLCKNENGTYQLDLWKANEMLLLEAGISAAHIENGKICTCCNSDFLFSHRASNGKRGSMAAFMMLKNHDL